MKIRIFWHKNLETRLIGASEGLPCPPTRLPIPGRLPVTILASHITCH
jgi:hypothetical protein